MMGATGDTCIVSLVLSGLADTNSENSNANSAIASLFVSLSCKNNSVEYPLSKTSLVYHRDYGEVRIVAF